ncbi:hypothetical protein AB0L44_15030 [Nonomuraea wenchangensis]|uniref:hypothetical protein n=1 Tax=Nonomuraea wenchangensis TaxID=568860 RepID=UPI0034278168
MSGRPTPPGDGQHNSPLPAELFVIDPSPGGTGWFFSLYRRIGRAKIIDRRAGGFHLYGIYGVRRRSGWELFTQREGRQGADGVVTGRPLLADSADLDPYLWSPAEWFTEIRLFVAPAPSGCDEQGQKH